MVTVSFGVQFDPMTVRGAPRTIVLGDTATCGRSTAGVVSAADGAGDGEAGSTTAVEPRCAKVSISRAQAKIYSTVMTAIAPPTIILARREKRGDGVVDDMVLPRRRPGKG